MTLEDYSGLTVKEVSVKLKEAGIKFQTVGDADTVTGQIPAAHSVVPGGSEILLYFGQEPASRTVEVPDFAGMNRQQAADEAGKLGLYVLATGNTEVRPGVTVSMQNINPKTKVPVGTTVTLTFTDTKAGA